MYKKLYRRSFHARVHKNGVVRDISPLTAGSNKAIYFFAYLLLQIILPHMHGTPRLKSVVADDVDSWA